MRSGEDKRFPARKVRMAMPFAYTHYNTAATIMATIAAPPAYRELGNDAAPIILTGTVAAGLPVGEEGRPPVGIAPVPAPVGPAFMVVL